MTLPSQRIHPQWRSALIVAGLALLCPARAAAQDVTTDFTQVTQSPPYLNCSGRVTVNHQGTVLMRGTVEIRDASGSLKASGTSGQYSPSNPLNIATEYGTENPDPYGTWFCNLNVDIILDYGEPFNVSGGSQDIVCPGERGQLIQEYRDQNLDMIPDCNDFTQSVPTPSHYSWGSWKAPSYSWALLKSAVTAPLYCIINQYGSAPTLTSGYRNPVHNVAVGMSPNSRHVYGDAADIDTPNNPDNTAWNNLRAIAKSGVCFIACVEPRNYTPGWFHADYRPSAECPATW